MSGLDLEIQAILKKRETMKPCKSPWRSLALNAEVWVELLIGEQVKEWYSRVRKKELQEQRHRGRGECGIFIRLEEICTGAYRPYWYWSFLPKVLCFLHAQNKSLFCSQAWKLPVLWFRFWCFESQFSRISSIIGYSNPESCLRKDS